MRKRVAVFIMLFTMVSVLILNCGQSIKYIAEKDEVIEWHSYGEGKSVDYGFSYKI